MDVVMWELDTLASKNYTVMTLAQCQKGIGGLLLEFWIGAGKSSHSCGKLHYFYNDFVCEDKE